MVSYSSSTSLVFKFSVVQFKFLEQNWIKLGSFKLKWRLDAPAPRSSALARDAVPTDARFLILRLRGPNVEGMGCPRGRPGVCPAPLAPPSVGLKAPCAAMPVSAPPPYRAAVVPCSRASRPPSPSPPRRTPFAAKEGSLSLTPSAIKSHLPLLSRVPELAPAHESPLPHAMAVVAVELPLLLTPAVV
jgi:hypothetical protein